MENFSSFYESDDTFAMTAEKKKVATSMASSFFYVGAFQSLLLLLLLLPMCHDVCQLPGRVTASGRNGLDFTRPEQPLLMWRDFVDDGDVVSLPLICRR